jgi:transcriptional regulator with GAF, ATPase, and Fis domain
MSTAPLTPLIDLNLPFTEALQPIEESLRATYLAGVLRAHKSVAAAARHAGVERANFKRLLKRYGVTPELMGEEGEVGDG